MDSAITEASRMMRRLASIGAVVGLCVAGLFACADDPSAPGGTVVFVLEAPLCSSTLPVEFLIDSVVAGRDTFRVNLSPEDTISPTFRVQGGTHLLGARVVNGYIWPDTTVTIAGGESITRILPFYCS
jgi:hypothetical protein